VIHQTWNRLIALLRQLPRGLRQVPALAPLAAVLLLIPATAALLGTIALRHDNTQAVAESPLVIARADVHSETQYDGKDLEMNIAISQIGNDCQAPLNGGFCLRYSVVLDEKAVMIGYGIIPVADVRVTPSSIVISVDTSKVPHFVYSASAGGLLSVSWKIATQAGTSPSAMRNKPQKAAAQGSIATYSIASSAVIATVIYQ
jgi:hypothetical protein